MKQLIYQNKIIQILIIAKLDYEQSEKDLAIAESDLKPTASLSLERSYADDLVQLLMKEIKIY